MRLKLKNKNRKTGSRLIIMTMILSVILCSRPINGWAAGEVSWVKGFGGVTNDLGHVVAVDGAGNVYFAGYFGGAASFGGGTLTSGGGSDMFLAKFSPAGVHQWSESFGSTGEEIVTSMGLDTSGNIFVAGYCVGTVNFGGATMNSAGQNDIFIAKYSPQGLHQWSQRFGGTQNELVNRIAVDSHGNVVVAGTFQGTSSLGGGTFTSAEGGTDSFVAKYSNAGAHLWSKNFPNSNTDFATGLALDKKDNIFVTGYFYSWVDFGAGPLTSSGGNDIYAAKFSPRGGYLWAKNYGDVSGGQRAFAGAVDPNGDLIVAGDFNLQADFGGGTLSALSQLGVDSFLAKFSGVDGSYKWATRTGGKLNTGHSVATDRQGNIFLTGSFDTWTKNFGSTTLPPVGGADIFVAKYSPLGALIWADPFGGPNSDDSYAVAVDPTGRSVATGLFAGTAPFGTQNNLISTGGNDVFLLKLEP